MAQLTIELDAEREKLLEEIAASERRSTEDLFLEALDHFFLTRGRGQQAEAEDPYEPLRKMIGLVEGGPTDASIYHDIRPGEKR
jgi:hypothetical protein